MLRPRGLSKPVAGAGVVALAAVFGVIATLLPLSAEDQSVATPENPAVVTAEPPSAPPADPGLSTRDLGVTPSTPDGAPPPAEGAPPEQAPEVQALRQLVPDPAQPPGDPSTYISVDVMSYTPPSAGRVEAVVKLNDADSGEQKEIGRFSIFPNAPFKAADPLDAQRFMFKVDESDVTKEGGGYASPKLTIELVPAPNEKGEGARLELGKATVVTPDPVPTPDKPIATPASPAIVTAKLASPEGEGAPSAPQGEDPNATYVAVEVTGYTPPKDGNVQAVVKILDPASGELKEIGRFGIFPNNPFHVDDPLDAQRFMFKIENIDLKPESNTLTRVLVDLIPAEGYKGEGASLEVGQALIEKR